MIEIACSPKLKTLVDGLGDDWEAALIPELPFPLAYTLEKLRRKNYAWEFLLKDTLHILLKYLAIISTADYLHTSREPDFDVNDGLKQLMRNMSEGHWMEIIRACALRKGKRAVLALPEVYSELEKGELSAGLVFPRIGIKTGRQGILSTLITARNKFFGHGMSLSREEKEQITPQVTRLLRAALAIGRPLWRYDLVHMFQRDGLDMRPLELRGLSDFRRVALPDNASGADCFLMLNNRFVLKLFPMIYGSSPEKHHSASILDEESELYILNQIAGKKVPAYMGLNGGSIRRTDLKSQINEVMQKKRVWENRKDIATEYALEFINKKTAFKIEDAERNNLYIPERYVDRDSVSQIIRDFINDKDSRALFMTGVSGAGKTAAAIHFIRQLNTEKHAAILIRAVELPTNVVKPKRFEHWLSAELGLQGVFSEILARASKVGNGRFVILIDGMNEFIAAGRDASLLFGALNHFIADYADHTALKVIMTSRSDSLGVFLPKGSLPLEADESLYFRPHGADYYEIGLLADDEVVDMLARLQVHKSVAKEYLLSGGEKIRNPSILAKVASGAIAPEDLVHMDRHRITTRFLVKRIGRDRHLKHALIDLVELMGKSKDMVVSADILEKRAPKMLQRLQADNSRILTTLRDLEIIQQIDFEDDESLPSWKLSISHDSIFEVISRMQAKRRLYFSLKNTSGIILIVLATVWLAAYILGSVMENLVDRKVENLRVSIYERIDGLSLAANEESVAKAGYERYLGNIKKAVLGIRLIFYGFFSSIVFALTAPIALLLLSNDLLTFLKDRKDIKNRDVRLLYFGREETIKSTKKLMKYLYPSMVLFIIITLTISAFSSNVFIITSPLLFLMAVLIVIVMPIIGISHVRNALNGSALLKEYSFSKESRRDNRFSFVRLAAVLSLSIGYTLFFCQLSGEYFLPKETIRDVKGRFASISSERDREIINTYPISKYTPEKLLSLYPQRAIEAITEYEKNIAHKLLEPESKKDSMVYNGLIFLWVGVLLSLGISQVVVVEIGARIYNRHK